MLRQRRKHRPLPLPTAQAQIRQRAFRRHRWGRVFAGVEFAAALVGVAWVLLCLHVWRTPLPHEWFAKGTLSLRLLDRHGQFLHEQPAANGQFGSWLPAAQLPNALKQMTLAAEDHRITHHPGVDPWAILRAVMGNFVLGHKRSGASTLAMQLARLLRPAPRTYKNKIKEMRWALILQHRLGPDGVLREYMNRAPYGNRVQGVQRAALLYFDRPAADLGLGQAAFLAALPWGPGLLNPFHKRGKRLAQRRAHRILHRAFDLGMISKEQRDDALRDPIHIQPPPRRAKSLIHLTDHMSRRWQKQLHRDKRCKAKMHNAKTCHKRHKKTLNRQLNTLVTTIDLALQNRVQRALQTQRQKLKGAGVGAAIVIDHRTGEVLAYLGSHDYFDKANHGAIDYARVSRAPGSTLKPFVYALAIQQYGYTGATLLDDLATTFLWKQGAYIPKNHDTRFLGPMRLRKALGNSRNIPVLRVLSHVGIDAALDFLRGLGLHELKRGGRHYGLGLALGSAEVSLLSLARAYGVLARNGKPLTLRWTKTAYDSLGRHTSAGRIAKRFQPTMPQRHTMRRDTAQILKHILADPIARLPSFGRFGLMEFPFPVAVKTGTSQGHRDAWMMAISDRLVVGCWIGNHDRRKMGNVYGTKGCGPVVQTAMRYAMKHTDPLVHPGDFPPPKRWKKHNICALSGLPASPACPRTTEEWFPTDHQHPKQCLFHRHIKVDTRNGKLAGRQCPTAFVSKKMAVSLPPLYDAWVKAMGLSTAPQQLSPLCGSPRDEPIATTLQIKQPTHRARFVMDPTIPAAFATLPFKAISARRVDAVDWYANGKKIGRSAWPYTMRWPMRRGRFHIVAMTKDKRYRSKPIIIDIK